MKLRMARNSLFAVLLRSRWWASLLVAAAIVLAAQALPRDLRLVGALGAVPFVVIAGIAAYRQWGLPGPAQVEALLATAAGLGWPDFDAALRQGLEREGWQVREARVAGADLVADRQGRSVLVSARRWKAARHGAEALAPLAGAMRREEAGGLYVALGQVSPQAARAAREQGIELLQGEALARVLRHALAGRAA